MFEGIGMLRFSVLVQGLLRIAQTTIEHTQVRMQMPEVSLRQPLWRLFQLFVHSESTLVIPEFLVQSTQIQQSDLSPVRNPWLTRRFFQALHGSIIGAKSLRVFRLVEIDTAKIVEYGHGCLAISSLVVQTECHIQ